MHFCLRCYVTERFSEPAAADAREQSQFVWSPSIRTYINTHMHTCTRTQVRTRVFAERYKRESELESGVKRESEAANACMYISVVACMYVCVCICNDKKLAYTWRMRV